MPSLAQGYGKGLLLGLQLEDAKRQKQRDEISDEFLRERLEDMRFQRKTLMSQQKEEEAEKKRQVEEKTKRDELIGDIATIDALGLRTGEQFMRSILTGAPPETVKRLTSVMDYVPGLSSEDQFKRTRVKEKVEGAPGVRPWPLEYTPETKLPEAAEMALGFKPKATTPTLPSDWLKKPEKQESAVQKWVTDWEKHIFNEEVREQLEVEALEKYPKLKPKSSLSKEAMETEQTEAIETVKRGYFNEWAKRVPADLRMEVREQVGMDVPVEEEPEYTQEQMDAYNACRDRGGTEEECRTETGL